MALEPALSLHRRIQELLLGFSRGITASLSVGGALESLCTEVNDLFGTGRVSVWIHYRRARELVLSGSSDRVYAAAGTRSGLVLHGLCPYGGAAHVGLAHGGGVVIGALLGMLWLPLIARIAGRTGR